jgi:hypothetical protein
MTQDGKKSGIRYLFQYGVVARPMRLPKAMPRNVRPVICLVKLCFPMNMIGNTSNVRYRIPNTRAHLAAFVGINAIRNKEMRYQRLIRKIMWSERSSAAGSIACASQNIQGIRTEWLIATDKDRATQTNVRLF